MVIVVVVVYGNFFFMVNWMDSIIERIGSTGMVKRECIRFTFIPSQISSFRGCQTDFRIYNNKTTLSQTVSNTFCFLQS